MTTQPTKEPLDPLAEKATQMANTISTIGNFFCGDYEKMRDLILAELRKVQEEARNKTHCKVRCGCYAYDCAKADGYDEGLPAGRKQGLEEAAKVADDFGTANTSWEGHKIAEEIQSLIDAGERNA